jgi:hypothetical protein
VAFRGRVRRRSVTRPSEWAWLVALVSCACSSPTPHAPTAPNEAELAPHRGALTDYVPAAGLRWLVAGSPRQLASADGLATLRQRWLGADRTLAFSRATGIDLTHTERALVAGFDLGTLYMVDASAWVSSPERAFVERLAGSEIERRVHPSVTTYAGLAGTEPQALVRVDDTLIAVAVAALGLARVVESFALQRFERVATAFEGAALSSLPPRLRSPMPLAFYLPGPLDPEAIGDAAGVLAGAFALVLTLEPQGPSLGLELSLSGSWETTLDAERLLTAWHDFSAGPLGRQLALDAAREPAQSEGSETLLTLRTQLDAGAFALGLERLSTSDVNDLLGPAQARPAAKSAAP